MATIFDYLMSQQPTGAQSLMSSLPFLNLPKKQAAYLQPGIEATHASVDTDSPLYQKIYGQQRQQGQRNLAETIAELQRQNRKQTSLGRTPLFNAERGGETLFRGLMSGYDDVQDQASTNTRDVLGGYATNLNNIGLQQAQLATNKAGIKGNLLGALTKLFGL